MGAFEYVAYDQAGKETKGLIEGDTAKHVRQILRDRHMLPVEVTEVAQKEARRQRSFSLRSGMSPSELAIVTRQLASLSQSGLPLEEALLAVAQQNDLPRTKSILLGVRSRDVDCAFKVLPRTLVQSLPLESSGAMISTEMLARVMVEGPSARDHAAQCAGLGAAGRPGPAPGWELARRRRPARHRPAGGATAPAAAQRQWRYPPPPGAADRACRHS